MGRSPPVSTEEEWKNFTMEFDLITPDRSILPYIWLAATEGDKHLELARLDHWPQTEVVKNETKKLEAIETVWRDYYTGQRLDNWKKPYTKKSEDTILDDQNNCMQVDKWSESWSTSWYEWECTSYDTACPCSYPGEPLLRLRGLCKNSLAAKESDQNLSGCA